MKIHVKQIKNHKILISIDVDGAAERKKRGSEEDEEEKKEELQLSADIKNIFHSSAVKSGFYSRELCSCMIEAFWCSLFPSVF